MKRSIAALLLIALLITSACAPPAAIEEVPESTPESTPAVTPEPTPQETERIPEIDLSNVYGAYDSFEELPAPELFKWAKDVYLPVKPPKVGEFYGIGFYDVDDVGWRGISEDDLSDFCEELNSQGWITTENDGWLFGSNFIRDNDLLYIADQSFIEEGKRSEENFFTVKWERGCKTPCADGRVSAKEAAQLIWPKICEMAEEGEVSDIAAIAELEDEELFAKLGMQVFKVFCQNGYCYPYIVRDTEAYSFLTSDYDPVFADIDGDGTEEYITLTGVGSGIYRYFIIAYGKSAEPKYISEYYPVEKGNEFRWKLEKREDGAHLTGVDYETGEQVTDIGVLEIADNKLVVTNIEEYAVDDMSKR